MTKDTKNGNAEQSEWRLPPEELIRRGERELIRETIEVEIRELLSEHESVKMSRGQRAVVGNG